GEAAVERRFRRIDLGAIAGTVLLDMRLIAPQRRRRRLDRQRHLARSVIPEAQKAGDQLGIAGDEARAQPGGARALRERVEDEQIARLAAERGAGLEPAGRRRAVIDLRVALVDDDDEIVLPREADDALQVGEIGDRTLRIAGRAEIKEG